MYDTLSLMCRAQAVRYVAWVMFAVHKGNAPTDMTIAEATPTSLTFANGGPLIYSDLDGVQAGYENFVIFMNAVNGVINEAGEYAIRYVNVGTLMPADAGTYHCSARINSDDYMMGSGALTITVNTKQGQARSSNTQFSQLLTYSAVLIGASKNLF